MKRRIASIIAAVLVSSASSAQEPPHPAVGMTQSSLIACAGLPAQSSQIGATTYLEYTEENRTEGALFGRDYCEATVEIVNGVVTNVMIRRGGGLVTRAVMCNRIFRACGF